MARFNEILVGRYNRFFQKLFQMKGGAVTPQLSGDIQPGIQLFSGREHRVLEAWQTFAANVSIGAGGAGFVSAMRMRMPVAANVVAVIERLEILELAATGVLDIIFQATGAAALANEALGVTSLGLDPRSITNGTAILSSSVNAGVVAGQSMCHISAPVNTPFNFVQSDIQELPLLPGAQYSIVSATLNQGFQVNVLWRERFLEESERT